jgi:hypothetical protein
VLDSGVEYGHVLSTVGRIVSTVYPSEQSAVNAAKILESVIEPMWRYIMWPEKYKNTEMWSGSSTKLDA